MHELNIRFDRLYEDSTKWNSLFNTLNSMSSNLAGFVTDIPAVSSTWKTTADLVYNVQGFWEEPILVVFHKTFNMVGNFLEVRNWLNTNFDVSEFSPTQLIRCDFLCKNYTPEKFKQYPVLKENRLALEVYAKTYNVKINEVYTYLSHLNQLNSIKNILNSILVRNSRKDLYISSWDELSNYTTYVGYNYRTHVFTSTEFTNFSETDLQYFYSYMIQYKVLQEKMNLLLSKNIDDIPEFILNQFTNKNLEVYNGGSFFFRNNGESWDLYPYIGTEFCTSGNCSDCYDIIDVNKLYTGEKPCFNSFEYELEECYE